MKYPSLLVTLSALGLSLLASSCQNRHHHPAHHPRSAAVVTHQYRPGYQVRSLPPRYETMDWGGNRYYYSNNVYYRPYGGGYVVVENPRGRVTTTRYRSSGPGPDVTVVRTLPGGYRTVTHRGVRYYQHGNTYYQPSGSGYRIVASPYDRRWR
jgi:hypothetical protein